MVVVKRRATNFRVRWPERGGRAERSFKTEADAKRFALEMANALEAGGGKKPAPKGMFAELVAEAVKPSRHRGWSQRHAETMEALARNHMINEEVGLLKCEQVTKEALTDLLQDKVDEGYALNTVSHVRKILMMSVRRGIELGIWNDANHPMAGVKLPRPVREDDVPVELHRITKVPTDEQVEALADHFEKASPKSEGYSGGGLLVRFAAKTGMRQGEQLSFQKKHIDWDNGVVLVRRNAARDNAGQAHFKRPKSEASIRYVPISAEMAAELAELCKDKDPEDIVFTAKRGGVWNRSYLNKLVKQCPAYAGYTWHDLRHYRASTIVQEGGDAASIAAWLGHANPYVTLTMYVGSSAKGVDRLRDLI